ncbi:sensor histidine kinase [Jannaschia sp. R86511]|uniref:sensor histidine kinase n=1 Tax=Jannaschia sp. R86511 TaxID=3093853 RepID=UPI0036D3FA90
MSTTTYLGRSLLASAERPDALLRGVLVVRWCVLVWLVVVVISGPGAAQPAAAAVAVVLTGGWTAWLALARPTYGTRVLLVDLLVCGALLVVATLAPALATVYPVAAALSWGARRGLRGGAVAGALLGAVYVGAHVVQGLVLDRLDDRLLDVLGTAFSLVLAGAGVGLVSTLLQRSAAALQAAQADRLRAREEAARLAEREELGRQVHDSVLQVLSLVHKRGRELADSPVVDPRAVAALADLAAAQERELRDLVLRPDGLGTGSAPPDEDDQVSLTAALQEAARHQPELDVQVSTVGELVLPGPLVRPLVAAVGQALGNVARHAGTPRAWLFAEVDDGLLVLTVRDDGRGFVLDEDALRAAGRMGLLRSIRGRVEQLGGQVVVDSAPGRGTELELRVPLTGDGEGREHGGHG